MGIVHDISNRYKKRIDDTNNCAGCSNVIADGEEYKEVVLPSASNGVDVTHIALCKSCSKSAMKAGVI